MPRRLCLLFDGTWNNRRDATNVTRMRASILSRGTHDPLQPVFYDAGVGTHWYDRLTGGAFGRGLSENIRQGYLWASAQLGPGDQLFVFGFSRGAYTARSLVGLVRKCGLLNEPTPERVAAAYELYRDKDVAPDDPAAVAFRARHARETRVRFIGVWDTVGALGVPLTHVPFSRDYYRWHDTELSKIVDHACHAMAVDERRPDYDVTRWTQARAENLHVEQRWFAGAHANVGGGYDKSPPDPLPNPPLRWLQDRAEAAGLVFREKCAPGPEDHLASCNDSFAEFLFGLYRRFRQRHERVFGTGVHETVDDSVWDRWRRDPSYRPLGLAQHPDRPVP